MQGRLEGIAISFDRNFLSGELRSRAQCECQCIKLMERSIEVACALADKAIESGETGTVRRCFICHWRWIELCSVASDHIVCLRRHVPMVASCRVESQWLADARQLSQQSIC